MCPGVLCGEGCVGDDALSVFVEPWVRGEEGCDDSCPANQKPETTATSQGSSRRVNHTRAKKSGTKERTDSKNWYYLLQFIMDRHKVGEVDENFTGPPQ